MVNAMKKIKVETIGEITQLLNAAITNGYGKTPICFEMEVGIEKKDRYEHQSWFIPQKPHIVIHSQLLNDYKRLDYAVIVLKYYDRGTRKDTDFEEKYPPCTIQQMYDFYNGLPKHFQLQVEIQDNLRTEINDYVYNNCVYDLFSGHWVEMWFGKEMSAIKCCCRAVKTR